MYVCQTCVREHVCICNNNYNVNYHRLTRKWNDYHVYMHGSYAAEVLYFIYNHSSKHMLCIRLIKNGTLWEIKLSSWKLHVCSVCPIFCLSINIIDSCKKNVEALMCMHTRGLFKVFCRFIQTCHEYSNNYNYPFVPGIFNCTCPCDCFC